MSNVKTIHIYILILTIISGFIITPAFAQEFKKYILMTKNRFTIQYADNWEWTTIKEIGTDVVRFFPSDAVHKDVFVDPSAVIFSEPAEKFLDTTDMKVKLRPPESYIKDSWYIPSYGNKLVKNNPMNVTGADSAWKIEYTHTAPAFNGERYFIQVDAIKNETRYTIQLVLHL